MIQRSPSSLARPAPAVERALLRQDRTAHAFLRAMGGLVPDGAVDLSQVRLALDVACGVGTWTRTLAAACPRLRVVGIDRDLAALDMARFLAEEQGLTNLSFIQEDARSLERSLAPRERFDLVHISFLAEALLALDYPTLLRDLFGLLRPGGTLLWTEMEFPLTTSPACERLFALTLHALQQAGQTFLTTAQRLCLDTINTAWRQRGLAEIQPDRRQLGITAVMGTWIRQAGYERLRQDVTTLDVSRGQPLHPPFVSAAVAFGTRIQPFLTRQGVIDTRECAQLRDDMYAEVRRPDFCGLGYALTISARKPAKALPL